jgi:N-acyl-D-amino-acid deacylase
LLKPGYYADLIVFQPEAVKDEATYEQPELLASGMHYVIVNGKIAVEKGNFTGLLAGRTLRNGK